MPVDVDAVVLKNVRLSDDYNVLALDAPVIGEHTRPGQFVMIKAATACDSLLRRPFSVFEVLRDESGVTGITILNKRAGPNTRALYALEPGARVACLGPLGKPFSTEPSTEAWMVAGGVGLAPFATLADALAAARIPSTLFYGARTEHELFHLEAFERLGVSLVLSTEDGSRGVHGRVTAPLEQELVRLAPDRRPMIYACGPEAMLASVTRLAAQYGQRSQVSVERVMGCGLGGCYSCVITVRGLDAQAHFVRSCLAGPVFDGADIVWE
ncbi:MAG: dihydroorotate dehydrogenase electron transfer subunit [Acidobacteriota bacterium]